MEIREKNQNFGKAEYQPKETEVTREEIQRDSDLQLFLDAFPFYVMLLDTDHKILLANKAIKNQFKLTPEQIIGEYCPRIVHGLEEPYPGCPLEEALEKGHGVEQEFFDPDTNRWVNSAVYPTGQFTQDGREIFIHYIIDITEKKRAEIEIRRNIDFQTPWFKNKQQCHISHI